MESMENFSIVNLNLFFILYQRWIQKPYQYKLEIFLTIANDSQPLNVIVKISAEFLNTHTTTKDNYQHYQHFCQVFGCFFTYLIDIGSIQNTYQIVFLFLSETKSIDPICISDRALYDMYRINLGVQQQQMKTLTGLLDHCHF